MLTQGAVPHKSEPHSESKHHAALKSQKCTNTEEIKDYLEQTEEFLVSRLVWQTPLKTLPLQDRKLAAQGFTPVTYSLSANACAYNSPELSHRSNNDTIYLSSPEMQNAQYVTLPQLATTLPHGFQMPQSDGESDVLLCSVEISL